MTHNLKYSFISKAFIRGAFLLFSLNIASKGEVEDSPDWLSSCRDSLYNSLPCGVESSGIEYEANRNSHKEDEPDWSLRFLVGVGTNSSLGDLVQGDADILSETTVYSLELGRTLYRDLFGLPIDISANFGLLYHVADESPSGVFQYNLYVKAEWTKFWWDSHLRTKFGVGEGLSYVDEITFSETVRRDGDGSVNLLNYLDFSLSFNAADLVELLRLDRLFRVNASFLDDSWVVANISHRSGVGGLFGDSTGDDGSRNAVTGGDNILMVGFTHQF